ncbi:hypothetical protein [Evansella cellulosilytica]|uniref:Uncharacterized protein n=1 Tax=Evansella cellulosilytica (strain ATCC 21833 / DSM 2522 / FERM P-1141 / JCM 9156 / N-4) TaxID=649639 RepID=E6TUB3_EVAC2|nr:hypothetical protein [Evansella cellulosilytica]ADU29669.1 hypothetical protein Bcell_1406 [Evansella cellulosilytica DSM 2522]
MAYIASLPYVTKVRVINSIEQKVIEKQFNIVLYKNKVVTEEKEFLLNHVFDITFHERKGELGFLYLHTNQGVFSFQVKVDPSAFIETYKNISK